MKASALVLALAACHADPPKAPPGTQTRRAEVAVADLAWAADAPLAGDATGEHAFVQTGAGVVEIDWQAGGTSTHADTELIDGSPLRRVRATSRTVEWPGAAPIELAWEPSAWDVGLVPGAAVPLIVQARREGSVAVEGWRADGTSAWRVELPRGVRELKRLIHLGDVALIQLVDHHDPVVGWTGSIVALDAATGAERWRLDPTGEDYPAAAAAIAHGDELAMFYEMHVEVRARADGRRRRRIHLDRSWMTLADQVGFDGDVVWSFQHEPPHDNPGNHMWGSSPREPSPARCTYLVYDTRHDRRSPIRTEANATGEAREWLIDCTAHAILPLADGGVQVLVVPRDGVLQAIWFDHPL